MQTQHVNLTDVIIELDGIDRFRLKHVPLDTNVPFLLKNISKSSLLPTDLFTSITKRNMVSDLPPEFPSRPLDGYRLQLITKSQRTITERLINRTPQQLGEYWTGIKTSISPIFSGTKGLPSIIFNSIIYSGHTVIDTTGKLFSWLYAGLVRIATNVYSTTSRFSSSNPETKTLVYWMVGLAIAGFFSAIYSAQSMSKVDGWIGLESWTLGFLIPFLIPAIFVGLFVAENIANDGEELLWGVTSFLLVLVTPLVLGNLFASEFIVDIAIGVGGALIFGLPILCLANLVVWFFDKNSYPSGNYLEWRLRTSAIPIFNNDLMQFLSTFSFAVFIGLAVGLFPSPLILLPLCTVLGCLCGLMNFHMKT